MAATVGITALLLLLLAGAPIGFSLLLAGTAGLYAVGGFDSVLGVLASAPRTTVSTYEFITIPMFLLMAEFIIRARIADDLFRAASMWVGRLPGGLAIATAVAGAAFGAVSGSSTAAAATLSATSVPAMLEHKYEPRLACGVVAISGTLAMLIPPSIAIVLYGIIADQSIGRLLIAGVIPGLLVTLTISLTVLFLYWLDPSRAPRARRYSLTERLASLRVAGPMSLLFLAVTGSIYLGLATPTEASALGAIGALVIALSIRRLSRQGFANALRRAGSNTCMIAMIIVGAHVFGYFFALTQVTPAVVNAIKATELNPYIIMAILLALYVVLGFFLDQIAILILTVPVVLPVIVSLGFDPIWFGIIIIVTAEVGMVTPPVGMNVFVVHRYTGRPLTEIFSGVWPHLYAHLILIAILVAFPQLTLWLPDQMQPASR